MKKLLAATIMSVFMMVFTAIPVWAATDSLNFRLTANDNLSPTTSIEVGDKLTISLFLESSGNENYLMSGMQNEVMYDREYLKLDENSIQAVSWCRVGFRDVGGGTEKRNILFSYVDTSLEGQPRSSSITIATFVFEAVKGGNTDITNNSYKVFDENNERFAVTTNDIMGIGINAKGGGGGTSHALTIVNPSGGTITASPGGSLSAGTQVTLTISLNSGYSVDAWQVRHTNDSSQSVAITTSTATTAVFIMPNAPVTITATLKDGGGSTTGTGGGGRGGGSNVRPSQISILDTNTPIAAIRFVDVTQDHWAFEYVEYLAQKGFVTGKTSTIFAPSDPITRAEFVTILARMSGDSLPVYSGPFQDVEDFAYYAQAVAWAIQAGVTVGTSEITFSPNNHITRQEMAAMILRYAKFRNFELAQVNEAIIFSDQEQIHQFALEAVSLMQRADIINGYPDGSFRPLGSATRAEAAKMFSLLHFLMNS